MTYQIVGCSKCRNKFLKDTRHINENEKMGHNFFCSATCLSSFRNKTKQNKTKQNKTKQNKTKQNKRKEFVCHKNGCNKKFLRAPGETSRYNFCSHSCAASYSNGLRYGHSRPKVFLSKKKKRIIKLNASKMGGINRWKDFQSIYTQQYVVLAIQDFVAKYNRIPLKKEMGRFYRPARILFGTWNNAIIAAGFKPNPVLFADRCIAKDGHNCDSIAEMLIDDYLYEKKIFHERTVPYPEGEYTVDFKIKDYWIEYFGLAGEHKRYDELREIKINISKKYKLSLIEIYPKDLYPKSNLDGILERTQYKLF